MKISHIEHLGIAVPSIEEALPYFKDVLVLTARVRETIYNTLTERGIEIPFPQCDVHMRD